MASILGHLLRRLAIIACSLALLAPIPAQATNVTGWRAGTNSTVTFNKSSLTALFDAAFNYNDANSIEPTDINTLVFVNTFPEEVNVYDAYYGDTGWYGIWDCQSYSLPYCYQSRVRINLSARNYSLADSRSLICEEVGHSVGLDHHYGWQSCMSQSWNQTKLDSHDMDHLNSIY